jgi:Thaumatin family
MKLCVGRHQIRRFMSVRLADLVMVAFVILSGVSLPCVSAAQPPAPPIKIEIVNESDQTVLFAAFGPTAIEPEGGAANWAQPAGGSLTLDIPASWYNTQAKGSVGPRIWARTGCRYNVGLDRAQCETGDCAGHFDCGTAGPGGVSLVGVAPVSIAEFCLNCIPEAQPALRLNYWDVSIVDGANLSMDIQPTGTFSPTHPPDVIDKFWCQLNPASGEYAPNSVSGADLRDPKICPNTWQLKSSMLGMFIKDESPDNVVACFSNCGYEEYPEAPPGDCTDMSNPRCGAWRAYCCQASDYGGNSCTPNGTTPQPDICKQGDHVCVKLANGSGVCPGKPCTSDADCAPYSTCWNTNSGPGTCACSGYAVNPPCPPTICTNVDLPAAEPDFVKCSQTEDLPGIPNSKCIGDDTVHMVFPRAYTWPNDPQTYDCDNTTFTVTVSPGGTSIPITPASAIPLCSQLPAVYGYDHASTICSDDIKAGAILASAVENPGAGHEWACKVAPGTDHNAGGIPPGILCAWKELTGP